MATVATSNNVEVTEEAFTSGLSTEENPLLDGAMEPKSGANHNNTPDNADTFPFLTRCDTDTTLTTDDEESCSMFSCAMSEALSEVTSEAAVKFGTVMVREYERVIDSTQIYMGLALGWDYTQAAPVPIEEEDGDKENADNIDSNAPGNSSSSKELQKRSRPKRTTGSDRYGMLLRYGYAQKELRKATDEAAKFYKQRQKEMARDAARSLVVADGRKEEKKRKPLFGSMFRR